MADATYQPKIYRAQGGVKFVVASGGEIDIEAGGKLSIGGTVFVTTGGNVVLGSLSSGNISSTGSITATSGIAGSSGTFTNGIAASSGTLTGALAVGGALSLTTGVQCTTGNFSGGVAISSALGVGAALSLTSGLQGTTGNFSGGVQISSALSVGAALSLTSGLQGTTGNFSGGVAISSAASVASTLTASAAFVRALEVMATAAPPLLTAYGVSSVWSSAVAGSSEGHRWNLPASTAAGVEKWIICTVSTAGCPAYVSTTSGGSLIDGAIGGIIFTTGAVNRQWVHLMAENTTNWMILSRSTDFLTSVT